MVQSTTVGTRDLSVTPALYEIGQVVGYVDLIDYEQGKPSAPVVNERAEWFCVMTNPNCERRAEMELYSLGYRTFAPKIRKWASHARVKKAVERPLLSRYLFVEIDHDGDQGQSYGEVRGVNGVEMLLSGVLPKGAWGPLPFPAHWVEGLLTRQLAGEWDEIAKGPIPVGARVRIIEGEFDNLLATVTNIKSGKLHCKILDSTVYTQLREHGVRAA